MSKPGLGRGLGALLSSAPSKPNPASERELATPEGTDARRNLRLDQIVPSPLQPRREFTPDSLRELAESIREKGIVQPLLVRRNGERFELIAGERRWRAARLAGLDEVPVIERTASDREVLELALIENLQRENLNPIEEARGYAQLIEQFQSRQEDVAQKVGKSRAVVANSLRLLNLPVRVQAALSEGRLSVGHAKVLLGLPDASAMDRATDRVLASGLSVRQTEELVSRLARSTPTSTGQVAPLRDPHLEDLEQRICQRLGSRVNLKYRQGKGALEIRFFSQDELERLLEILGVSAD